METGWPTSFKLPKLPPKLKQTLETKSAELHKIGRSTARHIRNKCLSNDIDLCDDNVFWKFSKIEKDSVKYAVNDCFIVDLLHGEEIPVFVYFVYCVQKPSENREYS